MEGVFVCLPLNLGSILRGGLPPPFFCSCEMLISVSFPWFICFGGLEGEGMRVWGGRGTVQEIVMIQEAVPAQVPGGD